MINHERKRYALDLIVKRLKFSPVILIQGPRQTGKSYLVKKLLPTAKLQTNYKTLDLASTLNFAKDNTDSFVRDIDDNKILIIDEAQKVPEIFDSIKAVVDEERIPGKFILLGSTEFSKLTKIRESLTGRAGRIRVFPLTLSEVLHKQLNTLKSIFHSKPRSSRNELLRYLDNGGMPGIFGIKDKSYHREALSDWISLTADRDCMNFEKVRIDPTLIKKILTLIATLDESTAGNISKTLRTDLRKINSHLNVLKTLFVINELHPHVTSTGKTQYYFCDVGFLNIYNASFEKKIKTFLLQELLAYHSYNSHSQSSICFYRSQKRSFIDFVITENEKVTALIKLMPTEKVRTKDFELLNQFIKKNSEFLAEKYRLIGLVGVLEKHNLGEIEIFPWESIV